MSCENKNGMNVLKNTGAQGDLYFRKMTKPIPADAKVVPAVNGRLVVGHSETGHHHYIPVGFDPEAMGNVTLKVNASDPLIGYLSVKESVNLIHDRAHHTHETFAIEPGDYEIRRQRERFPEGWRQVMD